SAATRCLPTKSGTTSPVSSPTSVTSGSRRRPSRSGCSALPRRTSSEFPPHPESEPQPSAALPVVRRGGSVPQRGRRLRLAVPRLHPGVLGPLPRPGRPGAPPGRRPLHERGHPEFARPPRTSAGGDPMNLLGTPTATRDPEISPAGPTTTCDLPEAVRKENARLVEKHAADLFDADAATILDWAREHAPGSLAVPLSMENTVLAEL